MTVAINSNNNNNSNCSSSTHRSVWRDHTLMIVKVPCSSRVSVSLYFLLQNLTSLILRENKLKYLPPEIGLLTQLTALDVSHNFLETLPEGN